MKLETFHSPLAFTNKAIILTFQHENGCGTKNLIGVLNVYNLFPDGQRAAQPHDDVQPGTA